MCFDSCGREIWKQWKMPASVSVKLYTSCQFCFSSFKKLCEYTGSLLLWFPGRRLWIYTEVSVSACVPQARAWYEPPWRVMQINQKLKLKSELWVWACWPAEVLTSFPGSLAWHPVHWINTESSLMIPASRVIPFHSNAKKRELNCGKRIGGMKENHAWLALGRRKKNLTVQNGNGSARGSYLLELSLNL